MFITDMNPSLSDAAKVPAILEVNFSNLLPPSSLGNIAFDCGRQAKQREIRNWMNTTATASVTVEESNADSR